MSEIITARMKWIVAQLKAHSDAVIRHRRDWFLGKSYYTLEWGGIDGVPYECHDVTSKMVRKLSAAGLIDIVEERPVYSKGEFRTTERDYGLPETPVIKSAENIGGN